MEGQRQKLHPNLSHSWAHKRSCDASSMLPGGFDRGEVAGEIGTVFHRFELAFAERVVVGDMRAAVRLGRRPSQRTDITSPASLHDVAGIQILRRSSAPFSPSAAASWAARISSSYCAVSVAAGPARSCARARLAGDAAQAPLSADRARGDMQQPVAPNPRIAIALLHTPEVTHAVGQMTQFPCRNRMWTRPFVDGRLAALALKGHPTASVTGSG